MALHAIDDVGDAFDATRAFLFPFDRSKWLKLALIVFFVGGVGANFGSGTNYTTDGSEFGGPVDLPVAPETLFAIVVAAFVAAAVLALLFLLVGSVMEFVFLEALRGDDEVHVRAPFREHFGKGLRLFGFRFVLGLPVFALVALLGVTVALAVMSGSPDSAILAPLFLLLPVILLVGFVTALVNGLTTAFVTPVMLLEGRGVLSAWRRFWPTLTGQWKEYLAYLVAAFVLSFVVALAFGIAAAIAVVVLLVPFGLVGGAALAAALTLGSGTAATVAWAAFAVVVALFVVTAIVVTAVLQVPVQTYLRYYALFVLGDTEEAFDLVPEMRATVRADETDGDATAA